MYWEKLLICYKEGVCGPVKETGAHKITDVAIVDSASAKVVSFHSDQTKT